MELQFDFKNKTITILKECNVSDLLSKLKELNMLDWNIISKTNIQLVEKNVSAPHPVYPIYPTYPDRPYPLPNTDWQITCKTFV